MAYVINLDEYKSIGTPWIAFYVNDDSVTYFDSFGVEHNPKEIKKFIGHINITTNIFRIQVFYSVMWGYLYIGFIYFMLKAKNLLEYINLFSPKKIPPIENLKTLKYHTFP